MKNLLMTLIIAVLVTLLIGCVGATGPKYSKIEPSLPEIKAGESRIFFYRPSGFIGGGLKPNILLNGMQIGKAVAGEIFYEDLKPGEYKITTTLSLGSSLELKLPAGKTCYVKLDYTYSFSPVYDVIYPTLVSPSDAVNEMRNLHFTGKGKYREY
jgi:Protein of unknown function (DUF2846)